MKKALFGTAVLLLLGLSLHSQVVEKSKVRVRATLVDKELNQKPVPHLTLSFDAESGNPQSHGKVKTDFAGNAEFQASPGKYKLTTPQGVDFAGQHFDWELEIDIRNETLSVDLSNDNARAA